MGLLQSHALKTKLSLLFGSLAYLASVPFASAATLTVNEYIDGNEAGNASGTCNLREAIQAINDGADIIGECAAVGAYGAADEIQFTGAFPQTYTLTFDAGGGVAHPLVVDNDVVITGPGSGSLTIDGNAETGIFLSGAEFSGTGINLDISGITLTNGNATSTAVNYFYYGGQGGGIHGQAGTTLSLNDVTVSSNTAGIGGGVYIGDNSVVTIQNSSILSNDATSSRGGGIMADDTVTSIIIMNTIIDDNRSFDNLGGGIYSQADLTDIRLSTISNNIGNSTNTGFSDGGGIYVGDQGLGGAAVNQFILIDSKVIGNSVLGAIDEAAGAYSQSGSSYIANTEFSGNSAGRGGGAVKINQGNAVVVNNTFSNNTTVTGEGTFKIGSTAFIYFIHNTITNNSTGAVGGSAGLYFRNGGSAHFVNNIIAENTAPGILDDCLVNFLGTLTTGGYNVIGINDGCSAFLVPAGTDNIGTSGAPITAGLNALADNGGPSSPVLIPQTHEATVASTNVWEIVPAATCAATFNPTNYGAGGSIIDTTANPFGASILALFAATTAEDQRGFARPGMTNCEVGAWENTVLATFDYGDAPDSYGTVNASTGAFHTIDTNLLMGTTIDAEVDGQPGANADGDDTNGATPDDEDGVTFPTLTETIASNITVNVINTTGGNAFLQAWIDFNNDGTFGAGEQIATDVPANGSGAFNLPVTPPAASAGQRYARFRLTPTAALGTGGDGGIGEVEDSIVTINAAPVIPPPGGGGGSGGGGGGSTGSGGCANISCFTNPPSTDPESPIDPIDPEIPEEEESETPAAKEEPKNLKAEIFDHKKLELIRVNDDFIHTKVWPRTGVDGTISAALARVYDATSPFKDLHINHPYFESTVVLYLQGVIKGYEDGTMRPDQDISRVEAIKLILLANNLAIYDDKRALFSDTEAGAWYQPYLNTAWGLEILEGYQNGKVGPHDSITFGEAFKLISKALELPISSRDYSRQHWAEKYADTLRTKNIIPPELNNGALYDQSITRAQIFALIYRSIIFKDYTHDKFIDTVQLSIPSMDLMDISVKRTLVSTTSVWLKDIIDNVGFYENPIPGKKGQLVIFGHSSKYAWDPNSYGTIFKPLINGLNVGDIVEVTINGTLKQFKISNKEKIPEENIERLKENNSDLILFTCDSDITERWVFSAEKI